MVRSFLNIFLPDDEYKRIRILYFMGEAVFLMTGILLLVSALNYYWLNWQLDVTFVLMIIPMLMMAYTYFRYIFAGMEHTEVSNPRNYKNERRAIVKRAVSFGVIVFIIHFIFKGIPTNWDEGIDFIGFPVAITIFSFLFDYISLKRSYKKNKDLLDD